MLRVKITKNFNKFTLNMISKKFSWKSYIGWIPVYFTKFKDNNCCYFHPKMAIWASNQNFQISRNSAFIFPSDFARPPYGHLFWAILYLRWVALKSFLRRPVVEWFDQCNHCLYSGPEKAHYKKSDKNDISVSQYLLHARLKNRWNDRFSHHSTDFVLLCNLNYATKPLSFQISAYILN